MAFSITLNQAALYFSMMIFVMVFCMYLGVAGTDHLEDRTLYDPSRNILYNNPVGYFRACANGINYTNNVFQDLGTYCDNIDSSCSSCYGPIFYCATVAECSKFNAGRGFLVMAISMGFLTLVVITIWGWKLYKRSENSAFCRRAILGLTIAEFFCAMVSAAVVTSLLSDSDNHIQPNTPLVVYKGQTTSGMGIGSLQTILLFLCALQKDDSFSVLEAAIVMNIVAVLAYSYHLWSREDSRDYVHYDATSGQPLKLEANNAYQTEHL